MRSAIAILLTLSVTICMPATAAEFRLDTQGGEPFYQTQLPIAVYQYTQRDDLRDLTITNAAGEQVPYALLPYEELFPPVAVSSRIRPLAIFSIRESRLKNPDGLRVELEKSVEKTTLNIISEEANPDDHTVMLVDAGLEHPPIQHLTVDWEEHQDQLLSVQILASDDLKTWSNAGYAALLKTTQHGQALVQNSIVLDSSTKARYLQIRASDPMNTGSLKLTGVTAEYRDTQAVASPSPPSLWQDIPFIHRDEEAGGVVNLDFQAAGHYPASKMRIKLLHENTVTSVSVLVRNETNAPWVPLASASVFHLMQHGKAITNPDLIIPPTVARYWRMQFNQSGGGVGGENPSLSLGWVPPVLIWNARGQAPYVLRVGETTNLVNRMAISSLVPNFKLEEVRQLPKATLQTAPSDTAHAASQNTWVKPVDYKRWMLWGGLLLGIALLAGMAYSLVKSQSKE